MTRYLKNKLSVGLFTDAYTPSINGVVSSVRGLAETLREQGHQVTIVAPKHPEQQEEVDVIRIRSTTYRPIPEHRMALLPSPRKLRLMQAKRFDVIHTHGNGPLPVMGLVLARTWETALLHTYHTRMQDYLHYYPWYPTLSRLAGPDHWYMNELRSRLMQRRIDAGTALIAERFDVWFANRCHYLITPTSVIKNELLDAGVKTPIAVVPNGIPIARLRTPRQDPLPQLPRGERLLSISRLGKEKSVDFLLDHLAPLLKERPDSRLVLVGDGPERHALEKQAEHLGIRHQVVFTGYVKPEQVADYYQHADVFVFASVTETQGMVALEAQACGLPVVARAGGGVTTTIEHGKTGYLVHPDHPEEFRTRVEDVLKAGKPTFADELTRWVDAEGSLETMAKRILMCYELALTRMYDPPRITLDPK